VPAVRAKCKCQDARRKRGANQFNAAPPRLGFEAAGITACYRAGMSLENIDILEPTQFATAVPHEQFTILRREAPIFWQKDPSSVKGGYWALTKHEDIVDVSKNARLFSSEAGGINIPDADEEYLSTSQLIMISMDPPQHTKYRKLVASGFTPRMIRKIEASIRQAIQDILDEIAGEAELDFVHRIAAQLPLRMIADMIGWPEEDRQTMFEWADRVAQIDMNPEDAQVAAMEFWNYCAELMEAIESGERERSDSLLETLMAAEVDGEKLNEMEVVNFMLLLAIGGNETTRNCISGGFLALHDNPKQLAAWKNDMGGLSESATEEMLRWTSPIICFRRTATADTQIRGQAIKEGDKVVLYYASANRDEDVFDDPQTFDIRRRNNKHLSFGTGHHFCLGATLARMEIRILFEELLKRYPGMKPVGPVKRMASNYVNSTESFMVTLNV
jgi:cholest-4-en-3-one 26-monooxygenase